MEGPPDFENREAVIDNLLDVLAEREGMPAEDILSDLMTFASFEGDESLEAPEYFEEMAERLGTTPEDIKAYAIKKFKDQSAEE